MRQDPPAQNSSLPRNCGGGLVRTDESLRAIAGSLAITAGLGTNVDLVGNRTKREIRAPTGVLSAVNGGRYEGWARCAR